ncbi:MAG: hypothetical protein ABSB84_11395 [Verrucomicrobiota bacterium]
MIPYWNALVLLAFFLVVVYLLSAFKAAHHYLEETVQRRTAALQAEIAERKRLEVAKVQAERLAARHAALPQATTGLPQTSSRGAALPDGLCLQ